MSEIPKQWNEDKFKEMLRALETREEDAPHCPTCGVNTLIYDCFCGVDISVAKPGPQRRKSDE